MITTTDQQSLAKCDYLVIGSGASSIAFVDTLLTELPTAKIVMIDKKQAPGGHWVDAYGYVHLHQPSLLYGVASRQLEGNWLKLLVGKMTLPWKHRASKHEILTHFKQFVDDKQASGQLTYFPNCSYDFEQEVEGNVHRFSTNDGKKTYSVEVSEKMVNGILGECIIPSKVPPKFPIDEGISIMTPNQIYDSHHAKTLERKTHYVVLGAGKTAMDAVVYLQRHANVKTQNISWVISNDVWMLAREGPGSPWSYSEALLRHDGDQDKACLELEQTGAFVRLSKDVTPTKFRFPVIGKDELKLLRQIKNLIRRGRVSAIKQDRNRVLVQFEDNNGICIPSTTVADTVFIHCTSPGPFNGNATDEVFVTDKQLNLNLLYAPPVSVSMSSIAYLEAARLSGTLDIQFGKQLLLAAKGSLAEGSCAHISEDEVLRELIKPLMLIERDDSSRFRSIVTNAMFLAIANSDPMVAYSWLRHNRLSFYSVPGFRSGIYGQLSDLVEKGKKLGFTEAELSMFAMVRDKLEPLKDV